MLELDRPGFHVELIVRHQNLVRRNAVEARHRADRETAAIHEGLRHRDPAVARSGGACACHRRLKFRLIAKIDAKQLSQSLGEPEPRVVPRLCVVTTRIAESDYQPEWICHRASLVFEIRRTQKRPAGEAGRAS